MKIALYSPFTELSNCSTIELDDKELNNYGFTSRASYVRENELATVNCSLDQILNDWLQSQLRFKSNIREFVVKSERTGNTMRYSFWYRNLCSSPNGDVWGDFEKIPIIVYN